MPSNYCAPALSENIHWFNNKKITLLCDSFYMCIYSNNITIPKNSYRLVHMGSHYNDSNHGKWVHNHHTSLIRESNIVSVIFFLLAIWLCMLRPHRRKVHTCICWYIIWDILWTVHCIIITTLQSPHTLTALTVPILQ